jgi:tRNA (guanine26-N2/guanine27-N2)-dimethyltransferase
MIKKQEGSVDFFIYETNRKLVPSKSMNVFYNSKMELNRDLTNLAILSYTQLINKERITVVDCMAASGIGAIRILKDCQKIEKIYINDINPIAVKLIKKNLKLNKVKTKKVKVTKKDASYLLLELKNSKKYGNIRPSIITIDPFGTPNIFLDAVFKTIQKKDGLFCITATDTAVLFGVRSNACIRKYLSKPLRVEYSKELGARILLHFISRVANINNLGIIPLLTFYSNHFIRIFGKTISNKEKIIETYSNYGYILHCNNCGFRIKQPFGKIQSIHNCPECGKSNEISEAGPLWIGELHDSIFIKQIIKENHSKQYRSKKTIDKLLYRAHQEIKMPITYYNIHKLCKQIKLPFIPKIESIIKTIQETNHLATRTHFDPLAIKTTLNLKSLKNLISKMG